ncbi:MAG: metal-dependent hydrolase [Ignavibacteriales bacterium]|nr:metal-dependent hydrolase [Ignavibacteriales bacterium]
MKSKKSRLKITWLGHAAFLIETLKGKRILIDPWLENPKAPPNTIGIQNIDLILITHGHSDHIGNAVAIAKKTNAKVIAIFELYLHLANQGLSNAQGMNKGGTLVHDDIKITMVDAKHSSGVDYEAKVITGGEAAGFVVELENGFKVYHAGDTSVFGDMKIIGDIYKPDLVLLPIGGLYTMGPEEAAYACRLLKPKYIIGMHYATFPILTGTPEALKKLLPAEMKNKVIELIPGEMIDI